MTMRIAYLVNRYPSVSHTFIRREIAALERAGIEVDRISIRESPHGYVDAADQAEAEQTTVLLARPAGLLASLMFVMGTRPLRFLNAMGLALRSAWRTPPRLKHFAYLVEACGLLRYCRSRGITHIHAHFGTNPPAVARLCRRLGGPGYSFTIHGPDEWTDPGGYQLAEKTVEAEFVACISHYTAAQLRRFAAPAHWHKIEIVRCSIDGEFLNDPPPLDPSSKQLVCVGRLCPAKGQLLLLEAFAEVMPEHPNVRLILCGDGEMRPAVEQRIKDLGLDDAVEITGWITSDEVRAHLAAARALVLPSFAEGLPVVIMESLVLARPVITTYVAGIPELVRDGENGWLIPAGDRDAISAAVSECLSIAAAQIAEMGKAGRAAVLAHHAADVASIPLLHRIMNTDHSAELEPDQSEPTSPIRHSQQHRVAGSIVETLAKSPP